METKTITISVAQWYGNAKYYRFMPRTMFAALEKAFISGEATAVVALTDLEQVITAVYA